MKPNSELNAKLQKMKQVYCLGTAEATGEGGNSVMYRHLVQQSYENNPEVGG